MNKTSESILITIGVVLIALLVFNYINPSGKLGQSGLENIYSGGATNGSTTLNTNVATQILARNVNRKYAAICTDSAGLVYVHETDSTSTGVTTQTGYPIAGNTTSTHCYIIDGNHLYLGAVYGIAPATTAIRYITK